jgi:hypothetical protein
MNNTNTARAPYIKHDLPEVKDIVNFDDRFWYVLVRCWKDSPDYTASLSKT